MLSYSTTTKELKQEYLKKILFQSTMFFYRIYDRDEKVLIFSSNTFDNAMNLSDLLKKLKDHSITIKREEDFSNYIIAPILIPDIENGNLMLMNTGTSSAEVLSLRDFITNTVGKDVVGAMQVLGKTSFGDDIIYQLKNPSTADESISDLSQNNQNKQQKPDYLKQIKEALLQNAETLLKHPEMIYSMRGFKLWQGSEFAKAQIQFTLDTIGMVIFKLNNINNNTNKSTSQKLSLVANDQNNRLRTISWEKIDRSSMDYLFPFLLENLDFSDNVSFEDKLKIIKKIYRLIGQYVITYSIVLPILYIQRLMQQGMKFSIYSFFKIEDQIGDEWIQNNIPLVYIHTFGENLSFDSNAHTIQPYGIPKQFTISGGGEELTYGLMRIIDEVNYSFVGLKSVSIGGLDLTSILEEMGGTSYLPQLLKNPVRQPNESNNKSNSSYLASLYPTNLSFAFNRGDTTSLFITQGTGLDLKLTRPEYLCYEEINNAFKDDLNKVDPTMKEEMFIILKNLNIIEGFNRIAYANALKDYDLYNNIIQDYISQWLFNWSFNHGYTLYTLLASKFNGKGKDATLQSKYISTNKIAHILWTYFLIQVLLLIKMLYGVVDIEIIYGTPDEPVYPYKNIIDALNSTIKSKSSFKWHKSIAKFFLKFLDFLVNNLDNSSIYSDETSMHEILMTTDWTITSFYRNYQKQINTIKYQYKKLGKTYAVTPFCSPHNYLLAIDLVIKKHNGKEHLTNEINPFLAVLVQQPFVRNLFSDALINNLPKDFNDRKIFEGVFSNIFNESQVKSTYLSIRDEGNFGYFWQSEEPWHFSMRGQLVRQIPAYNKYCKWAKTCSKKFKDYS